MGSTMKTILDPIDIFGGQRAEKARKDQKEREDRAERERKQEREDLKSSEKTAEDKAKRAAFMRRSSMTRTVLTGKGDLTEGQTGSKTLLGS